MKSPRIGLAFGIPGSGAATTLQEFSLPLPLYRPVCSLYSPTTLARVQQWWTSSSGPPPTNSASLVDRVFLLPSHFKRSPERGKKKSKLKASAYCHSLLRGLSVTTLGSLARPNHCQPGRSVSQRKTKMPLPAGVRAIGVTEYWLPTTPGSADLSLVESYPFTEHLSGSGILWAETSLNHPIPRGRNPTET